MDKFLETHKRYSFQRVENNDHVLQNVVHAFGERKPIHFISFRDDEGIVFIPLCLSHQCARIIRCSGRRGRSLAHLTRGHFGGGKVVVYLFFFFVVSPSAFFHLSSSPLLLPDS